jgi:hypothetical protein
MFVTFILMDFTKIIIKSFANVVRETLVHPRDISVIEQASGNVVARYKHGENYDSIEQKYFRDEYTIF